MCSQADTQIDTPGGMGFLLPACQAGKNYHLALAVCQAGTQQAKQESGAR